MPPITYQGRVEHALQDLAEQHGPRRILHARTIRTQINKNVATEGPLGKLASSGKRRATKALVEEGLLKPADKSNSFKYVPNPVGKRRRGDNDTTSGAEPAKRRKSAGGLSAAPPPARSRRASAPAPIRKRVSVPSVPAHGELNREPTVNVDEDGEDEEMGNDDGEELERLRTEVARLEDAVRRKDEEIAILKAAADVGREENADDADDEHEQLEHPQSAPSAPAEPPVIPAPVADEAVLEPEGRVSAVDQLHAANLENARLAQALLDQEAKADAERVRLNGLNQAAVDAKLHADEAVTQLQRELRDAQDRLSETQVAHETDLKLVQELADGTLCGANQSLAEATAQVHQLQATVAQDKEELESVQRELRDAQGRLSELEVAHRVELNTAKDLADGNLSSANQSLAEAREQVHQLQATVAQERGQLETVQLQLRDAQDSLSETQVAHETDLKLVQELADGTLCGANQSLAEATAQVHQLQATVAQDKEELESVQLQLRDAQEGLSELQKEYNVEVAWFTRNSDGFQRDIFRANNTIDDLRTQLRHLHTQLQG